ncbi:hypothetical protein [Mycobacteroides abscessus]|uniref:hypothetical protein n=1 Tax=Mycobacteroides abscessus TaxID=36809 RepID=UPI0018968BD7
MLSVATAASVGTIAVRERAADYAKSVLRRLWGSVDPYSDKSVREFATQAAKVMRSAQTASAQAAAAGITQQLAALGVPVTARPSNPLDVRARGVQVSGGALSLVRQPSRVEYSDGTTVEVPVQDKTTDEIFTRPAVGFRWIESEGGTREDAVRESGLRIDTLVDDNLMLAQRLAQAEIIVQAVDLDDLGKSKIIGTRRIIHPELSLSGTCGLCIAASDRIYRVTELLPIHNKCKCTYGIVTEEFDPADELNTLDLSTLYEDAGGTSAAHLKRTRYQVDEHGELGPVLVPAKAYKPRDKARRPSIPQHVTGKAESKAQVAARLLPGLQQGLTGLRAKGLSEDSPQITYHLKQIAKLQRDLTA